MSLSNVAPELQPVIEEVTHRFSGRIASVIAPRRDEVYFQAGMELVSGFCAHLY
jgi:hypothetical protein